MSTNREMPKYECHKKVWELKKSVHYYEVK